MNHPVLARIIRESSQPLAPWETDTPPQLAPLAGIRAVVFDIYGTLFVSGSGDIGLAQAEDREGPMRATLAAAGVAVADGARAVDVFHASISGAQQRRKAEGVEYPEVEIRDVWRTTLDALAANGAAERAAADAVDVEALAIDYECRVNPVWPMPDLVAVLDDLRTRGLVLGIVSNAQFFTPLLFEALLGRNIDELGFDPQARVYSYELREAKPSTRLYELLVSHLRTHDIAPHQVLYVGNDMRNDIWPARATGMKTALFAGDRRSLRLRRDDPRIATVTPDITVTHLRQIGEAVEG